MTVRLIIANDKGGVGKSTLAQMCVLYAGKTFGEVRAVEYDRQPKLGRFFDKGVVQSFSIAPDWETQIATPGRLAEFWDPMIKWMSVRRPLVADFGAQVWGYFAAWAQASSLGELVDTASVVVLVPVTADREALIAARRIVETASEVMPRARVVLLSCDKDGEVGPLRRHPAFVDLVALAGQRGVPMLTMPVLAAEGYPVLAAYGMRFDTICNARPKDLLASAGLAPATAVRTIKAVRAWAETMDALLGSVLNPAQAIPAAPGGGAEPGRGALPALTLVS
ncbi:hypothetical protein [Azospirillum halopraeferens]|uniref:hypothetical protein n=1 Tax=Azospirillum halopraeferens TaxID=34010 RepID=UPI00040300DB|nr:hypothetical protein [Azospirillum halopraeferens]